MQGRCQGFWLVKKKKNVGMFQKEAPESSAQETDLFSQARFQALVLLTLVTRQKDNLMTRVLFLQC